jgi:hypothetical protein
MEDAYVINLPHRTDRWETMQKNWSPYFNLIRYDGIMLPPDERPHDRVASEGLGLTHKQLLQEAQLKGLKTILILEDDAIPEPNWYERWVEIKAYLDSHLDEWETFNGGVHFLRYYHDVKELDKSLLILGRVGCASHFMYLNLQHNDKFLKWEEEKQDIDIFYCNNFKLYSAYPILSKQADGKSDIVETDREWDQTYMCNELDFRENLGDLYFKFHAKHFS